MQSPRPRAASTPHFNGRGTTAMHGHMNGHQRTTSSGSSNSLSGSGTSIMVPVLPSSFYAYIKRNIPTTSLRYHPSPDVRNFNFNHFLYKKAKKPAASWCLRLHSNKFCFVKSFHLLFYEMQGQGLGRVHRKRAGEGGGGPLPLLWSTSPPADLRKVLPHTCLLHGPS